MMFYDLTISFPKELKFFFPITPPFVEPDFDLGI